MVQKTDRERVRTLLKDTITLLCKNGLEFKAKFNLEALIGVTIDDDDVFLISINELVKSDSYISPPPSEGDEQSAGDSDSGGRHRRRKRKRSRGIKVKAELGQVSDQEEAAQYNDSEEDNGADDDDSRDDNDETVSKRTKPDSKSDIIIIKEELEDPWLQSTSQVDFNQFHNTSMDSTGGGMSQTTSNMWLPPSGGQPQYSPGSSSVSVSQQMASAVGMSPGQGYPPLQQQPGQQQVFGMGDPLSCTLCLSSFSTSDALVSHVMSHDGKDGKYCLRCNKSMTKLRDLREHALGHAGVKIHKCSLCDKRFTFSPALLRHMKNQHIHQDSACTIAVQGSPQLR